MSSGHGLNMCKLSCIINDDHIFLAFGKDLHGQSSCHWYMTFQLLQNMASGHIKVKKIRKWTDHVFYMVTPSHTTACIESVPKIQIRYFRAFLMHLVHYPFKGYH